MGNVLFHQKDQQITAECSRILGKNLDGDGFGVHRGIPP
jgi:hypothetical protein